MKLRSKVLLLITVIFACILILLWSVANFGLQRSLSIVEEASIRQDVARTTDAISNDLSFLDASVSDWGMWDDTYDFIKTLDPKYIKANITESTFTNLKLNLLLYVDPEAKLVLGSAFDSQENKMISVPAGIEKHISKDSPLLLNSDVTSQLQGILSLPEGIMLVASRPILTSAKQGPIRGTLIMGHYLDAGKIQEIARLTHLSVIFQRVDEPQLPPDFQQALASFTKEALVSILPLSEDSLAGYTLLDDIYGKPSLILRVDVPRFGYRIGQSAMQNFLILLLIACLIFAGIIYWQMNKWIFSRLSRLSATLKSIGTSHNLALRAAVDGKDEVTELTATANDMLAGLEKSKDIRLQTEQAFIESEHKFRELFNNMGSCVAVYKAVDNGQDFIFRDFNKAAEKVERIDREEVVGKRVTAVFPGIKDFGLFKVFQKVWTTGNPEHAPEAFYKDNRIQGWKENYVFKLPDGDIVAVYDDITERKKAEQELRESEEKFKNLSDELPEMVFINQKGLVKYVNAKCEKIMGYSKEEFYSPDFDFMKLIAPEYRDMVKLNFARHMMRENRPPLAYSLLTKDGKKMAAMLHTRLIEYAGNIAILGVVTDISELKQMEEALLISEQNFRNSLDNSPLGIRIVTGDGVTLYTNQALLDLYGFTNIEEFNTTSSRVRYTPESYLAHRERVEQRKMGVFGPKNYEISIVRKDGGIRYLAVSRGEVFWNGAKQYQVLYQDITAHKKAEEKLKESEKFNSSLMGNAPNPILVYNPDRSVYYVNPAFLALTGFTAADAIGNRPPYLWWPTEKHEEYDRISQQNQKNNGIVRRIEWLLQKKTGEQFWVEVTGTPVLEEGKKAYVIVNWFDITERKKAEEKLRESERFSNTLLENAPNPIMVRQSDGRIHYVNPAFEKITGFSADELIGTKPPYAWWPPEDKQDYAARGEIYELSSDYKSQRRGINKKGKPFWIEISRSIIQENDKVTYYLSNWVDFTERKQAEDSLKASEQKYRLLMDNAGEAILVLQDGMVKYCNTQALELSGYTAAELREKPFLEFVHPNDRGITAANHQKRLKGEPVSPTYDLRIVTKNGLNKWMQVNGVVMNWEGKPSVLSLLTDITKRKQAEEALRKSEAKWHQLVTVIPDYISLLDSEARFLFLNHYAAGFSPENTIGRSAYDFIAKDSVVIFRRNIEACKQTQQVQYFEYSAFGDNELLKNYETYVVPIVENDVVRETMIISRDITERKRMENALRASETRFRTLFEKAPIGVALSDINSCFMDANEAFCKILGYTKDELLTLTIPYIHHPEDRVAYLALAAHLKGGELPGYTMEKRYLKKNGEAIWVNVTTSVIKDFKGEFVYGIGMVQDITEHKQAEEKLKANEEKYRTLAQNLPGMVYRVYLQEHNRMEFYNDMVVKMTGFTESELKTGEVCSIDPLMLSEDRDAVLTAVDKAISENRSFEIEYRIRNKKGETRYCVERGKSISGLEGQPLYIDGIILDITERKKAEEALKLSREQLRNFSNYLQESIEAERKRISSEIHDELGQTLTALKIDLSWLMKKLPAESEPLQQKVKTLLSLVDASDVVVKRIAADIGPGILDDIGLSAAIQWYVEQYESRTGIKCILTIEPEDILLKKGQTVAVYRIVQETLTNVARHASATKIKIQLKQQPDGVILSVRDNGKGITQAELANTGAFGLMGMKERARQYQGELTIKGIPGKGTLVVLNLPVNKEQHD